MNIVVSCPECEKKIRVPEENIGKKVRCPACEHVFAIKAPKSAAPGASKPKPKPEPPVEIPISKPKEVADGEGEEDPYGVTEESLGARCPHCAKELESDTAVICLHCGYNLRSRMRAERKTVYENTPGDYFMHLLPGILCVLGIVVLIVIVAICYRNMPNWLDGTFLGDKPKAGEKDERIVNPNMFTFYIAIFSGFAAWKMGNFAYRRLVINYKPKEVEKKSDD